MNIRDNQGDPSSRLTPDPRGISHHDKNYYQQQEKAQMNDCAKMANDGRDNNQPCSQGNFTQGPFDKIWERKEIVNVSKAQTLRDEFRRCANHVLQVAETKMGDSQEFEDLANLLCKVYRSLSK